MMYGARRLSGRRIVLLLAAFLLAVASVISIGATRNFAHALGNSAAISPNQGSIAGGTEVTITGLGFISDAKIVQVAAGSDTSFAVDDHGNLYAWGSNYVGMLGDGTTGQINTPKKISGGTIPGSALTAGVKIVKVVTGVYGTVALDSNGDVYVWGAGPLGNGDINSYSLLPVKISGGVIPGSALVDGVRIVDASLIGTSDGLLVDDEGDLYGWGQNSSGELGDGTSTERSVPIKLSGGVIPDSALTEGVKIVQIASKLYGFTAAVDDQGNLYTWGVNYNGELGNGTTIHTSLPAVISGGVIPGSALTTGVKIAQVSIGEDALVARDEQGIIYVWGSTGWGQFGNGAHFADSPVPIQISDGAVPGSILDSDVKIAQVSVGSYSVAAIDDQNNVYTWGYSGYGLAGNGMLTENLLPVLISGGVISGSALAADVVLAQIAVGVSHAIAFDDQGAVYGWALNNVGQLGQGASGPENCWGSGCAKVPIEISGFDPDTDTVVSVRFGDVECTDLQVISDTELTCRVPARAAGRVDVTLTTQLGETLAINGYTYLDETIPGVPNTGRF